jgi:hypothetical protein
MKDVRTVQHVVHEGDSQKKKQPMVHSNIVGYEDNDEDSESIGSQDITNLLKKVMFPEDDELMNVLHCVGVQHVSSSDENDSKIVIADVSDDIDDVDNDVMNSTECVTECNDNVNSEIESEQNINMESREQIDPLLSIGSEVLHGTKRDTNSDENETHMDEIVLKSSTDKNIYTSLTNEELKKILKEKGLSTKGVKSELIMRIMDNE